MTLSVRDLTSTNTARKATSIKYQGKTAAPSQADLSALARNGEHTVPGFLFGGNETNRILHPRKRQPTTSFAITGHLVYDPGKKYLDETIYRTFKQDSNRKKSKFAQSRFVKKYWYEARNVVLVAVYENDKQHFPCRCTMINKVILIGNLGADPEIRYTQDGTPAASFTVATTERWKGKDGQMQEQTEWHRITAWRRLAEICGEYLSKGSRVYIEIGRAHV